MFVIGMGGMLAVIGSDDPTGFGMIGYSILFTINLVFGLLIYWVCCALWIGFGESLALGLVKLAGIYAISSFAQVVLLMTPVPLAGWLISVIIYISLLKKMLDLETFDAIVLVVLTFVAKVIAVFTLAATILSMVGADQAAAAGGG